jgi:hypothetical protein
MKKTDELTLGGKDHEVVDLLPYDPVRDTTIKRSNSSRDDVIRSRSDVLFVEISVRRVDDVLLMLGAQRDRG